MGPGDASGPAFGEGGPGAYAEQSHYGLAHPSGPGAYDNHPAGRFSFAQSVRRPWRRTLTVTVSTAAAILALGVPLGLLWFWLAPSVPVIDSGANGIVVNDPSPEEFIAADGWFTLLGLAFGLLAAIAAWMILRRDRGPFLLLGVVLGTLGASYLAAPWVAGMIGRSDYQHWQQTATQGATYMAPPELHALGPKLVATFIAAVALTLLAGWSNDPDLEKPGARPGYGPNVEAQYPPAGYDHPGYGDGREPSAYGSPAEPPRA